MGSRGVVLLNRVLLVQPRLHQLGRRREVRLVGGSRRCSTKAAAEIDGPHSPEGLEPPDVAGLAQTARISLTPREVEEFAPKIRQVVDWFGQLQAVELDSVEPAIRADTEGGDAREDIPVTFDNQDAMIAAIPSYDEPYIKVPKVLNKE